MVLSLMPSFFGIFLYAFGFVGNLFVPKTIDGPPQSSLAQAILINASLLLLFALQHSIMARPAFKTKWTKLIPEPIERSTYVFSQVFACFYWFGNGNLWVALSGR